MSAFELKLDKTQKDALQKVISAKLAKTSAHTDDNVLPEYIMVMVQNKKTSAQVSADLNAFLGKEAAGFTEWLWELLDGFVKGKPLPNLDEPTQSESNKPKAKIASVISTPHDAKEDNRGRDNKDRRDSRNKNKEKREKKHKESIDAMEEEPTKPSVHSVITPAVESSPRPQRDLNVSGRLLMTAVKDAVDDTKKDAEGGDGGKRPRGGSGEEMKDDRALDENDSEEEKAKKLKTVRCQFWPNCKRGDQCLYHHPSERCKYFPNCTFGDQCLFIHPTSEVPCKFGASCNRPDCTFVHPTNIPCKNGFACYLWNGSTCKYLHPPEACKFGEKCTKGPSCIFSHGERCKFGSRCTRISCSYAHLVGSQPLKLSSVPCKFGLNCKNKDTTCTFTHPDDPATEQEVSALSDSLPKTPPREETEKQENTQ